MRIWSPPRVTWGISLSILEPGTEETCAILPHIGTVAFGFSGRVFFSGGGRRFSRLVAKFLATMDSGIFFVHSVDLGMFGRVPATSLQTVASMCFFPRTAPRRAQVWARPVGAGGQQRQIPHVRRSHPGLGCLGSPFRSFNFDLRFLFRGLRAYTHPGLLCRSLARSLSLSLSLSTHCTQVLQDEFYLQRIAVASQLPLCPVSALGRRACSLGSSASSKVQVFSVTRALPYQACTTPLPAPGLASGRRGSGQWTASTPTGARSTRARVEAIPGVVGRKARSQQRWPKVDRHRTSDRNPG